MSAVLAQQPSHLAAQLVTQRTERGPWLGALAIALTLEVALLAGLLWWSTHHAAPEPPAPVDIVLAPSPAPTVQAPPAPKPPPPKLVQPPRPRPPVHTAPRPVPTPAPPPPPAPTPAAVAAPPPAPATRPAMPVAATTPMPPPLPVRAASDTGAQRAAFEAQLRAAVQAAVHYPVAAKLMRLHGKTLVAFDYQDRRVRQVRVAQSSGSGELDRAAQAAVQGAEFPPPPAELAGRTLHFDVWVRFFLQDEAD